MGKIVLTSYISHGAPTSLVERTKLHDAYEHIGKVLTGRGVDTVVISSPHYFTGRNFEVESRESVPCIQDYYGFPDELYKFSYQAKNNPALVEEIVKSSIETNLPVGESQSWGLDHGAWLPLYFMFPDRNVRVVPVSIGSSSPEEHFKFGRAIRSAASKIDGSFAVFGTGSPVHRLDLIRYGYYGEDRFGPGEKFDEKLIETVSSGDVKAMLGIAENNPSLFNAAAPEGNLNPLYTALGTSNVEDFIGETIEHEFMYFGVSLVAIILSAETTIREALRGSNRTGLAGHRRGGG